MEVNLVHDELLGEFVGHDVASDLSKALNGGNAEERKRFVLEKKEGWGKTDRLVSSCTVLFRLKFRHH